MSSMTIPRFLSAGLIVILLRSLTWVAFGRGSGEVGVGECWIFDVVGDVCLSGVFWDSNLFFSSGSIS